MAEIEAHLNTIQNWKTELVQVSKQDIVRELSSRTTPIFTTLLQTIQQQQERITTLEGKLNICTT